MLESPDEDRRQIEFSLRFDTKEQDGADDDEDYEEVPLKDLGPDLDFDVKPVLPDPRPRIARVPGAWMVAITETVFSKQTAERINQTVADFRDEYVEAVHEQAGRSRMFWVALRHWYFFINAVLEEMPWLGTVLRFLKGA